MIDSCKEFPYVRKRLLQPSLPPVYQRGIIAWIHKNFFGTPKDILLTALIICLLLFSIPGIIHWVFLDAVWIGSNRTVCTTVSQGGIQPDGWNAACWAFIYDRYEQFIFGNYPMAQRWRPILVFLTGSILLTPMLIPSFPRKFLNSILLFGLFPIFSFFVLYGGLGLSIVETSLWGGLLVTLVISFFGIIISMPLGILLALGRNSNIPVLRYACITFIELFRGVPLVTVLFMASIMLPLFLPDTWDVDKLLRALLGVSAFASAYIAEVLRGGLQSISKGQFEAANSLGLSYLQKMRLIIMPQVIKRVIPGIVNTFIGLFKDSSLISIINMFDLLGIVRVNFSESTWISSVTPTTGLIFIGFVFWIFCFSISLYSVFIEKTLHKGSKK
ncbi:amino acid ABC transporter permease [Candidatus Liberibacter asiaticus]|uniref:General L-amino acid transport system permease protein n=2 Tax=Liberibacter asiaticus TaxID=34021 RepID=C6XHA0_LIBAP|nr:amino acid ABC transporter permease [Candidatus Liberibacter asiaticus]ACT56645.1 general L-amino acid transport system permease protein [Candidatus Liberibacter asiaticus str. psy62]AGH16412.1 general L-amino acid transport system permease [Candidatus Liberibacter asiaticus str. gxpsy]ALK06827.1 ABC transporter permease subunit [Candidatus Liberibacter asiaticus]ASK52295.1 amino acid ABC transporter permease [Candidatus Liberibacter asiaticus]AWL13617.1 amino acid ABC transporter permease 